MIPEFESIELDHFLLLHTKDRLHKCRRYSESVRTDSSTQATVRNRLMFMYSETTYREVLA